MEKIPVFGTVEREVNYQERFAAYIVIADESKENIVLVQAPNGAYFLPGGEIEGNETKEETIRREMLEELGYEVVIDYYIGQADEYFHSNHRQTDFYNPGYFYAAKSWKKVSEPLEDFNQVKWFPVDEAIEKLKRGSHKWAVEEWLKRSK